MAGGYKDVQVQLNKQATANITAQCFCKHAGD